ncbi:type II toxin-antitoxin system HicB family antitoxin [Streptosporangium sp. G11]|uniref:type II toxin-antitoxin system HicB family antitoxin n=1 Tax=Streptosporangium sp. G11 TaxID=3436926 RepID=UPI003EBCCE84
MQTHFDKIFDDEPEAVENPDEFVDVTFTSYNATATRVGKQWNVTVHDLPEGRAVLAQGATWADAHRNAHTAVITLLDVEQPYAVGIRLTPDDPELAAALQAVMEARIARADAEQAERDTVTRAAQLLTGRGWSTRDAGNALSLSHQRISQLAPRGGTA